MRKKLRDPHLGPAELETLRFVLEQQPTPVRTVADHFAATRGYGRTTVLKTMERLRAKGYLKREEADGVNVYSSTRTLEELDSYVIEDFVQMSLGGSVSPLLAFLTRQRDLTPEELKAMKSLVDKLDSGDKK
jgi:predicted transcriptional regulator